MPAALAPSTAQTLTNAVIVLPEKRAIRVAPDAVTRKVVDAPRDLIPMIGICDWQPAGDGTYKPIVRIHERNMRISEAARILDVDYWVLRRLLTAKFITGSQPTPSCWLINLHSYFDHLAAVQADPEFWNEARRARYSAAL